MSIIELLPSDHIRLRFSSELTSLYKSEVAQYDLMEQTISPSIKHTSNTPLYKVHHGAIRLGSDYEFSIIQQIFSVMGMHAVDYYDLSASGLPVHSTAFRPITTESLNYCPFRMFTSLLRLELIDNEPLGLKAKQLINQRNCFSEELLTILNKVKSQGGLKHNQLHVFLKESLNVFRWYGMGTTTKEDYLLLSQEHPLLADIVCFKGPHINHLTPRVPDIENAQEQLKEKAFRLKKNIEGPPKRKNPILLRQTSFIAIEEPVIFNDDTQGTHTARFGEIEERGIALTPKGRELYDACLNKALSKQSEQNFKEVLLNNFEGFPDDLQTLWAQGLAFFYYKVNPDQTKMQDIDYNLPNIKDLVRKKILLLEPIQYEDFLPVSAAGIFQSNLSNKSKEKIPLKNTPSREKFEKALGVKIIDSFNLYKKIQSNSLKSCLHKLGIKNNIIIERIEEYLK